MAIVLKNLVGEECYVFIDDVIIFSKTAAEHASRLENVLARFEKANLHLHPGKCVIVQPQVNYLGYVLSENGVSTSADKVEAVKNYPTPKNVRDVRSFLGLASFYGRLVPDFAALAKPLTSLIRKDLEFIWGPNQQQAFEDLKNKLCTMPVLAYPDFSRPFILTTDASKAEVAAVLSQVQEGIEQPIAYTSRQMNKPETSYTASEAEMLALVWAAKYFRCYLYSRKFVVRTDHAALMYLKNFGDQTARLMRWSLKLCELDFTVEHGAGSKIPHVDALSRHVGNVLQTGGLCRETVLHEQARDKFCQGLKPGTYQGKHEFFFDDEGLIYRRRPDDKHQLIVPSKLVADVIRENHDPVYIAHPGIKRTCELLALSFWWLGMHKAVEEYIKKCDAC